MTEFQEEIIKMKKQIVIEISNGKSTKQIAAMFYLTESAIYQKIRSMYEQYDVQTHAQLVAYCLRNKIIE
jgi:DNA-binding CsgD family transcriptional regulator